MPSASLRRRPSREGRPGVGDHRLAPSRVTATTMVSPATMAATMRAGLLERIGVDGEERLSVLDDDEGLRVSHWLAPVEARGASKSATAGRCRETKSTAGFHYPTCLGLIATAECGEDRAVASRCARRVISFSQAGGLEGALVQLALTLDILGDILPGLREQDQFDLGGKKKCGCIV